MAVEIRSAILGALMWPGVLLAQDAPVVPAPEEAAADVTGLLAPEALDELMAPVALYPDLLLAQVLFATTYPLDVIKADRFLLKSAEMPPDDRSAAIATQDWAEPVLTLAAGFPELVGRMAEHIDWTEQTGEAVIAQTDDVLDSVQRLRDRAAANGYLEDNAAMVVATDETTGDISISSANAEVIYVPTYPETVYTQAAPATATIVTDDDDWGDALATGAIVFGSALIIDEIFDDDDWDNGWGGGYWRGDGGTNIDWNGNVDIDNSVNVGGGGGINIGNGVGNGGGGINIGNGVGNGGGGINLGNGVGNGDGGLNLGNGIGNGVGGLQRPGTGDRPGARPDTRPALGGDRPRAPDTASRDAARDKIAKRQAEGRPAAKLPTPERKGDRVGTAPQRPAADRPAVNRPAAAKPAARPAAAPAKITRPKPGAAPKRPAQAKPATRKAPAFKPDSGSRARAAGNRGNASRGNRRG